LIPECLSHLMSFHSTICSVSFAYYDFLNITKNVKNSFFSNVFIIALVLFQRKNEHKYNITERVINISIVFHGIPVEEKIFNNAILFIYFLYTTLLLGFIIYFKIYSNTMATCPSAHYSVLY
jgi:hypothetical protein